MDEELIDNSRLNGIRRMRYFAFGVVAVALFCLLGSAARAAESNATDRLGAVNGYPNYKVAVMMVKFADSTTLPAIPGSNPLQPWNKDYIEGKFFNSLTSMSALFTEISNSQVSVQGSVFDRGGQWYVINRPATLDTGDCDWTSLLNDSIAAGDPDIDYTAFNNIFILTPSMICSPGGFATRAKVPEAGNQYYRTQVVSGFLGDVHSHEMGHVVGMNHANFWKCPSTNVADPSCSSQEYGDPFSLMSVEPWTLHPAAEHKERLGWLLPAEIITVVKEGDYTINVYEKNDGSPKVIKIPRSVDPTTGQISEWYYLEYRQPVGLDVPGRTMTGAEKTVFTGALVHYRPPSTDSYVRTYLVDSTPGSCATSTDCDQNDAALQVGSAITDTIKGISFGVVSRTDASMVIRVRFDGQPVDVTGEPCVVKSPNITLNKFSQSGKPRSLKIYTLVVENRSTANCSAKTFTVKLKKGKKDWSIKMNGKKEVKVTLASGKKAQINLRLISPKNARNGGNYFTFRASMEGQSKLYREVVARYVVKK